ncbi:MAG: hypothetical protein JSU87_17685 [Gemmatimonadota bacterium]|nr:MAG: hypothetical protein JSU87_17685 [Gemmatimonadota bacterium]
MTSPKSRSTGGAFGGRPTASGAKAPELRTLGGVRLISGGSDETSKLGSKHLALLIYLSQEQRPMHPSEVTDMLGRGGDDEKEMEALKRVVAWLRDNVPGVSIRLATDTVEIYGGLRLDTRDVDAAIDGGDAGAVAELYTGEFLEDFQSGVPSFDDWAQRERGRLKRAWRNAMLAAAHDAERQGRWEAAARWWQVLTARAPLRAEAVAGLLNALALAGRMSEASESYIEYLQRLHASGVSMAGQAVTEMIARHRIPVDAALLKGERSGATAAPDTRDQQADRTQPGKSLAGRKGQPKIVDFSGHDRSAHHLAWQDNEASEAAGNGQQRTGGAGHAAESPSRPAPEPSPEQKVSRSKRRSGIEFVLPDGATGIEDEGDGEAVGGLEIVPAHRVKEGQSGNWKRRRYTAVKHEVTSVRKAWGPFLRNAWVELAPWRRAAGEAIAGATHATGRAILVALRSAWRGLVFLAVLPVRGLGAAAGSLVKALHPRKRKGRKAKEEEKRRASLQRLMEQRPWLEELDAGLSDQAVSAVEDSAEVGVGLEPDPGFAAEPGVTEPAVAVGADLAPPPVIETEVHLTKPAEASPVQAEPRPREVAADAPEATDMPGVEAAPIEEAASGAESDVEPAGIDVRGEFDVQGQIDAESVIDRAGETGNEKGPVGGGDIDLEEGIGIEEEANFESEFGLASEIDFDVTDEERGAPAAGQIEFGDHSYAEMFSEEEAVAEASAPELAEPYGVTEGVDSAGTEDAVIWFEIGEASPETFEPPAAIIPRIERPKRRRPLAGSIALWRRWLPVVVSRWLPALRRRWYVPVGIVGLALVGFVAPRLIGLLGGWAEQVPARLPEVEAPSLPKVSLPKVDVPTVTVKTPAFVETGVSKIASLFSGSLLDGPGQWLLVADVETRGGAGADSPGGTDVTPEVLTLALETGLQQARFFNVVPRERALLARAAESESSGGGLSLDDALTLAAREGYAAVVRTWVSRSETGHSVGLQLLSPAGDTLYGVTAEVAEGANLEALNGLSRAARRRLGEPAEEIDASAAATQVLSASPEALRDYAEARQHAFAGRFSEAVNSAEEATRRDSTFAMAYRMLAESYAMLGQRTRARSALEQAWRHSGHLSERERYRLLGDRHVWDGRYQEAVFTYDELFKRYRDDVGALKSLALVQAMIGTRGSGRGNLRVAYAIDRYDWPRLSRIARYLDFRDSLPDVDSMVAVLSGQPETN